MEWEFCTFYSELLPQNVRTFMHYRALYCRHCGVSERRPFTSKGQPYRPTNFYRNWLYTLNVRRIARSRLSLPMNLDVIRQEIYRLARGIFLSPLRHSVTCVYSVGVTVIGLFLLGSSRCQWWKVTTNWSVSANEPTTNGNGYGVTSIIISSFSDDDTCRYWRPPRCVCEPSVDFGIYAWTRLPVTRCRKSWPCRSCFSRSTRSTPNDIRISCATHRRPRSRAKSTFSIKYSVCVRCRRRSCRDASDKST